MTTTATTQRHWNGYVSALGGLAAAGVAAPADASVLYTGNVNLTMNTVTENIYFDLDHSGPGPYVWFNPSSVPTDADLQLRATGSTAVTTTVAWNSVVETAGYYLSKLSAGTTIDASLPWWTSGLNYFQFGGGGAWNGSNGDGYLGLRIKHGSSYNYGYAHISFDDANNLMTLLDFAIETTPDTAISTADQGASTTPSAPEPSTLMLAALGLGGVALRRRRAAAAAAAA